jgi:hypothetical protein
LAHIEGFGGRGGFGRKVDLRTPQDLSGYFRDEVTRSAAVQYARG